MAVVAIISVVYAQLLTEKTSQIWSLLKSKPKSQAPAVAHDRPMTVQQSQL